MQGGFFHEFFLLHEILLARVYTRNRPPPQIVPSAAISTPITYTRSKLLYSTLTSLPPALLQKVRNAAIFTAREPFSTAFPINGAHLFSPHPRTSPSHFALLNHETWSWSSSSLSSTSWLEFYKRRGNISERREGEGRGKAEERYAKSEASKGTRGIVGENGKVGRIRRSMQIFSCTDILPPSSPSLQN